MLTKSRKVFTYIIFYVLGRHRGFYPKLEIVKKKPKQKKKKMDIEIFDARQEEYDNLSQLVNLLILVNYLPFCRLKR